MKGNYHKTDILTERQKAVLETIRMRLSEKEALKYLRNTGFEISDTTWYREKSKLEETKWQRLHLIASAGFVDQHLERIDQLEIIQKEMWINYHACEDPFKKTLILEKIANVQPYLSGYYEDTKEVMKESSNMKKYYIPEFETSRDNEINTNSKN